jgi:hypothetical protein
VFDSAILDVGIGLAFIFLIVSLLVSAAAEALSGWMKWRSQHLWAGLEQLLQSKDARDELYSHPLIKGLARVDLRIPKWNDGRNGPSYIPSRTFALAVIDILREPHRFIDELKDRLDAIADQAKSDPSKVFEALKKLVDDSSVAAIPARAKESLTELWNRVNPQLDPAVVAHLKNRVESVVARIPQAERNDLVGKISEWVAQADGATDYISVRSALSEAIGQIPIRGAGSMADQAKIELESLVGNFKFGSPEEAIQEIRAFASTQASRWLDDARASFQETVAALSPLMDDAAGNVERFRENIEIWFNDGMDRVSGWYKRHIGYVQAVIALILAAVMNIDALQITRTLWREPTLRQSLVAKAEGVVATSPPALEPPPAQKTAQPSSGPGKDVAVRLSRVRLAPEESAIARVMLPTPALTDEVIVAESQASHLLLGSELDNIASKKVELKVAAGETDVSIFVKAEPVTSDSREGFTVTALGQRVVPEVVIAAAADQAFARLQREIGTLGLPIGWTCPADTVAAGGTSRTNVGGPFWCEGATPAGTSGGTWWSVSWWLAVGLKNVLAMIIGWLITAAATSMGAPFWFDTLKRIVSIRSSGKAPEERPLSPKEVPQPREPGQRPKEADLVNALKH